MSNRLLVRSWDRPDLFELGPSRGLIRRCSEPASPDKKEVCGFLKSCAGGKPLVAYSYLGSWYLQVGGHRWRLADGELRIEVKKWLLGRRIEIDAPGFHHTCRVIDLGDWLGRRLDPTYDHLDQSANDFPLWLAERRAEARRGPVCTGIDPRGDL